MRLNAKTKRKGRKDVRAIKDVLKRSAKFEQQNKFKKSTKIAVVVPFVAPNPKQNEGYRSFTAEEIVQAKLDRFTALAMDAQADEVKKYTQNSVRKGKITSVVVIDSGVNNSFCHKNLAMAIPFMKSQPAMRPLYSTHRRNSPINKRGKLIRPKLIFTKKGYKEGGEYIKGHAIPQHKATKSSPKHLVYPQ